MGVFGKKGEAAGSSEDSDFLRIPPGTRIAADKDGKLQLSFAGDMSFGEAIPELSELNCGRNLSLDAGVTLRADVIRVKATLEIEAGARLYARELEVERLVSRKGHLEVRSISAGHVELESSRLVGDRLQARESVLMDRGEVEIGTVVAQLLTVTKGTVANILVAEVLKLEGAITKGGYESFAELLAKLQLYHPELVSERLAPEAARPAGTAADGAAATTPASPAEAQEDDATAASRLLTEAQRLRAHFGDREMPRELLELVGLIEGQRVADVRRSLTPIYQRLAPQGKILPEPIMESFREIQRILRDSTRPRREARPA